MAVLDTLTAFDYAAETKVQVPDCLVCGPNRAEFTAGAGMAVKLRRTRKPFVIAKRDRYGHEATSLQCPGCGLVWISPRMTRSGYQRFYASGEYRRLVFQHSGVPVTPEWLRKDQAAYLTRLAPILGTDWGTVLDVGGSVGGVGVELGREITILDPAAAELEDAEGEQIEAFAEDFDPAGRQWDLVLVCRTIDHMTNPLKALRNLRPAVGGTLWVDAASWMARASAVGRLEGAMKIDHPYAFVPETLEVLLIKAGYKIRRRVETGVYGGFVCE